MCVSECVCECVCVCVCVCVSVRVCVFDQVLFTSSAEKTVHSWGRGDCGML